MLQAANAYRKAAQTGMSPREAEAAVLIKASGKLQAFNAATVTSSPGLNEALVFNQKVWTVFASAVADPANPLPEDLRDNVSRLALFVFRTIIDTMVDPSARKLDTLISLNNHLAAGLQGSPTPSAR